MKVAIICGGPSLERGISLNSARSILDHLASDAVEIVPFFLDEKKHPYKISTAQLYSNTPSDFDFKLRQTATPLSEQRFVRELKRTNIVFPVMHGTYGEDGGIQSFLEKYGIPYVGSSAVACKAAFDKYAGNGHIRANGFFVLPSALLKIYGRDHRKTIDGFFRRYSVRRAIVKPAGGGSSIGVFSVSTPEDALRAVNILFKKRMDTRVVVEPFAEGKEFTVILLQNKFGLPVALPPTEIETSYENHGIFDFRKKYLPTRHVAYHSPPRFDDSAIERIQAQAEQIFALFGMRDFARFDGWILPSGEIWFCDFNPISGMEQNSFLFQQASRVGLTHSDVLKYIVRHACGRSGIEFPQHKPSNTRKRKPVPVLFGGPTSERQVSLMSGTNVWLKLRNSNIYEPRPYLLDIDGSVWRLPYHLTLNHTVEEISENCKQYPAAKKRLEMYEKRARLHLGLRAEKNHAEFFDPVQTSPGNLLKENTFVFLALHGGAGENGDMQKELTKHNVAFNGPDEKTSRLCMDKWATAERIRALKIAGVDAVNGTIVKTQKLLAMNNGAVKAFWSEKRKELRGKTLVVKPRGDGCSTGVVHLCNADDLIAYIRLLKEGASCAPLGTFKNQTWQIELPPSVPPDLIFESFIETDVLRVKSNRLKHTKRGGYVEITVGVVQYPLRRPADGKGKLHALNPSITIAESEVLSVEEKFQGGTGVNLTPPPPEIMKPSVVKKVRERMQALAHRIGIEGYSRIDAFVHIKTGDLKIIEINTLPGLTPSTVLYHQALAENPPMYPRKFLETLIKNKKY